MLHLIERFIMKLAYWVAWRHEFNLVLLTDDDWDILVHNAMEEYVQMLVVEEGDEDEEFVKDAHELLDLLEDQMGRRI